MPHRFSQLDGPITYLVYRSEPMRHARRDDDDVHGALGRRTSSSSRRACRIGSVSSMGPSPTWYTDLNRSGMPAGMMMTSTARWAEGRHHHPGGHAASVQSARWAHHLLGIPI